MAQGYRPLAVVTGASTGIGFELARCAAEDGHDLVIAADESRIDQAARVLRETGVQVRSVIADLATADGVNQLYRAIVDGGRPVDTLFANAGRGLGHAFLDQDFRDIVHVIDTNITGTLHLLHRVGRDMVHAGHGRILITGSIAGYMPGTFQAVYNGTKAFLDSFAVAFRHELDKTGVTVTCLEPGATETMFFERADLMDTKIGTEEKDDPREVARAGYRALMNGETSVVTGFKNKMQVAAAAVMPADTLAEMHRKQTEPGTAKRH